MTRFGLAGLLLCGGKAWALKDPADYERDLMKGMAARVERLNQAGQFEEAIELARRFEDQVEPAGPVHYELAFALNRLGRRDEAITAYGETLRLDPDDAVALYDRGELYLLENRLDEARADFERAVQLRPDHWVLHFRLAELAAKSSDPAGFEAHLVDAVRNGFDFRTIVSDPNWRAWANDPVLGNIITKLIVLYSHEDLLELLKGTP